MRVHNSPGSYGLLAALLVLLVGLVANASCMHASKLDPPTPEYEAYYDSAVEITAHCTAPDGQEVGWFGSGVIISDTQLMTAAHVAETEGMVCSFVAEDVKGVTRLIYPVTVLESGKVDLAVMALISFEDRFADAPLVHFGPAPRIGDTVCTATAHPRREERCGMVMRPRANPPGDILMNMVVEPGNSGSGLYNMRGDLVGIVVHTYPNRGNGQFVAGGATSIAEHLPELLP